jgi:hypothetical protein
VLSLTARGLRTGEIAAHFGEVYGAKVSKDLGDEMEARPERFDPGWLHGKKCLQICGALGDRRYSIGTRFWRRVPLVSTT